MTLKMIPLCLVAGEPSPLTARRFSEEVIQKIVEDSKSACLYVDHPAPGIPPAIRDIIGVFSGRSERDPVSGRFYLETRLVENTYSALLRLEDGFLLAPSLSVSVNYAERFLDKPILLEHYRALHYLVPIPVSEFTDEERATVLADIDSGPYPFKEKS